MNFFKFHFWSENLANIGLEYTKRCTIATIVGVYFQRKVDLVNIFCRKLGFRVFEIIVELHYNLKNPKSQFSHENIEQILFSWKT